MKLTKLILLLSLSVFVSIEYVSAQVNSESLVPVICYLMCDPEPDTLTPLENVLNAFHNPDSEHIFVAAHRGGKEFDDEEMIPGNSIANIDNALSKGFDIYESDIEILMNDTPDDLSDDVLVVFHDDNFDNLTNTTVVNDLLDEADLNYAKGLFLTYDNDVVSTERIPTLEEFLTAAKDKIMVKFDLKSGTFASTTLHKIFDIVVETGTVEQVLIRGGTFLLDQANDNGYDTRMIMRRYNSAPTAQDISDLANNYDIRAISIPEGASSDVLAAAISAGLVVEFHELQGVTDQEREAGYQAAIDAGVRQFHSFTPSLLLEYLEKNGYREF
ncbi:MAG: glycerophosphodiester phosphodiesterase family protein [Acidiferrobacterales bacterium]|nr:glycerophosphodiester phosphodiesterase family protein [Acidiferrobacterales bacterium]